jgi:hypothetical protein
MQRRADAHNPALDDHRQQRDRVEQRGKRPDRFAVPAELAEAERLELADLRLEARSETFQNRGVEGLLADGRWHVGSFPDGRPS